MGQTIYLHPATGQWKEVRVTSYGAKDITLEFDDSKTYYTLSVFPGYKSRLSIINKLVADLLKLREEEDKDESKASETLPGL